MNENTWLPHLIELRKCLIRALSFFAICFLCFFVYANACFNYFLSPLLKWVSGKLLATHVASSLFVPIMLSVYLALFVAMPYFFYQVWHFIKPGLYQREKGQFPMLFFLSVILFYSGMAFCFYVVLPLLFSFLFKATPQTVSFAPDIASYMSFTLNLMLSFGLCFEVPVIMLLLLKMNVVSLITLKKFRPYLIVFAFIIGMLLTPPDVLSQVLLAIPICLLYELGLILGAMSENKKIILSP